FTLSACGTGELPDRTPRPIQKTGSETYYPPSENQEEVEVPVTKLSLTWKAVFMAGDGSINAFDNARNTVRSLWINSGLKNENLKELSWRPPVGSTVLKAGVVNLENSLK